MRKKKKPPRDRHWTFKVRSKWDEFEVSGKPEPAPPSEREREREITLRNMKREGLEPSGDLVSHACEPPSKIEIAPLPLDLIFSR